MKCKVPAPEPTEEEKQKQHKQNIRANDKRLHYADRLFKLSLHDNAGFGATRITTASEGAYILGREYIDKHTEEAEEDTEYAVYSYYAIARDLRGWGWDPEIELWSDDVFASFPWDKNTSSVRREWKNRLEYAKGISFYVKQMLAMGALHLREKRGWAQVRLGNAFHPVRDGYLVLMRQYMRCSAEGDARHEQMIAEVRKRYKALGYFETEYN